MKNKNYDKPFLIISSILCLSGIFVFISAASGLLARSGPSFGSILANQIGLGLLGGCIVAFILYKIPIDYIERAAPYLFVFSLAVAILVFVPGIGFEHGGAKRWILLAGFSFQPSELLKIAYIICFAGWAAAVKDKISSPKLGLIPFIVLTSAVGIILMLQPDTGTMIIIGTAGLSMYYIAGAPIKHILAIVAAAIMMLLLIVAWKPYVRDRVVTFFDPERDPYGSSYQIQQALIAVGSGGIFGRGFGQSVQKFSYLPEPIGDSIFAVLGEEFGLWGTTAIIVLFVLFTLRGLGIARRTKNTFGRLVVTGIVILIITQSFMNISAILGIIPLTGEPLVFISHGGTSLMFAIATVGIVLNISKKEESQS